MIIQSPFRYFNELLLREGYLAEHVQDILAQKEIPELTINRIAIVTETCFAINPDIAREKCKYVLEMRKYMEHLAVLQMFESFFENSNASKIIQKWLLNEKFNEKLAMEISECENICMKNLYCPECDRLNGLLIILKKCAESPVMRQVVCTEPYFLVLNQMVRCPFYVEDSLWLAFEALYGKDTIEFSRSLLHKILNIINHPVKSKRESGCAALRILAHMSKYDSVARPMMIVAEIPQIVIMLMISNPNHMHLHKAATCFISEILFDCKIQEDIMLDILPMIIFGTKIEAATLKSSLYHLIEIIIKVSKGIKKCSEIIQSNEDFMDILQNDYACTMKNKFVGYGGPLPIIENDAPELASKVMMKRVY